MPLLRLPPLAVPRRLLAFVPQVLRKEALRPAVTKNLSHIWTAVQDALRHTVGTAAYDVWLAPLQARDLAGAALFVAAPPETRDWISERFGRQLAEAAREVLGPDGRVVVLSADEPSRDAGRDAASAAFPEAVLNPKYTFGQFVIGDDNRLAHAAALAVAEGPGQAYNPLFIYGPPGVGKTHLLHSTTVERFTNEFIAALRHGSNDAKERFKDRYRRNDVLLIDDVQFLASKARTEEEFFHTFNALYDTGSQLVLTSDRLPRDLAGLEDRMRERFEAGLVTDVRAPDLATRLTVLRKRVQQDAIGGLDLPTRDVIARRLPPHIRPLEGATPCTDTPRRAVRAQVGSTPRATAAPR